MERRTAKRKNREVVVVVVTSTIGVIYEVLPYSGITEERWGHWFAGTGTSNAFSWELPISNKFRDMLLDSIYQPL